MESLPAASRVAVLEEMFRTMEKLQSDSAVKAIVLTGADGKFSAGFDITYLAKQQAENRPSDVGQQVNDALIKLFESGPKPTVAGAPRVAWDAADWAFPDRPLFLSPTRAAVANVALGGGLEVAMACNARVTNKGAQLGLPELQLGEGASQQLSLGASPASPAPADAAGRLVRAQGSSPGSAARRDCRA